MKVKKIKIELFQSVENSLKKKKKLRIIEEWIMYPILLIAIGLFFLTISNTIELFPYGIVCIGFLVVVIIMIYLFKRYINDMDSINNKVDDKTNEFLKKVFAIALNKICENAVNKEIQLFFWNEIDMMMENNNSSWLTKSGKLKTNWNFLLNDKENPIIIDGESYFFKSIKLLGGKSKYIKNDNGLLVKIKVLLVKKETTPILIEPITWLIPVEIDE